QLIYQNKKESKNSIIHFWKTDFPLFFYQYHKTFFYSFLIFAVSIFIGTLSSLNDYSFVRLIMGDNYVNLTLENIAKGEPTAIYKSGSQIGSFLGITINNIRVAFLAYAFGVITSVG